MKYSGTITLTIEPFEARSEENAQSIITGFLNKLPFEEQDPCRWTSAIVNVGPDTLPLDGTQTKGMKGIPADWDEDFR